MQPIRRGSRGASVADVQRRLSSLGHRIEDPRGAFDAVTEDAVRAFQDARGLIVDGIVGVDTWRELVEASWRLGDRVLYLASPNIRGDDVRDLQDRLATLGFDAGRIDGIFGPRTAEAAREFQRNYGLPADAVVGERTVRALAGLPPMGGDMPVAVLREREQVRRRPAGLAGMRVLVDPGHGATDAGNVGPSGASEAEVCFVLARRVEAALAASGAQVFVTRRADGCPEESARAALANVLDAEVFLGLHCGGEEREARGAVAYYYGHSRYASEQGRALAELLLAEAAPLGLDDGGAHAKTFTVLRETRMTAVVLEAGLVGDPEDEARLTDATFQGSLADAIARALARFAAGQRPAAEAL